MSHLPDAGRTEPQSTEHRALAAVDDALRSLPLRPAPPGLATAILAELRSPGYAPAARPVFRLSWMDFALSGFVALMLALVLLLLGWLTPAADRLQAMTGGSAFQGDGLVWALALGGLLATGGLLVAAGVMFGRRGPLRRI